MVLTDEPKIAVFCQFLANNPKIPAACMQSEKIQSSPSKFFVTSSLTAMSVIYVTQLCKLNALVRAENSLTANQGRLIMIAFIFSQHKNCPLVWMFLGQS